MPTKKIGTATTIEKSQSEVSDNALRLFLDSKLAEFEQSKSVVESLNVKCEAEAIAIDNLRREHEVTNAYLNLAYHTQEKNKTTYNNAVNFYQSTL